MYIYISIHTYIFIHSCVHSVYNSTHFCSFPDLEMHTITHHEGNKNVGKSLIQIVQYTVVIGT